MKKIVLILGAVGAVFPASIYAVTQREGWRSAPAKENEQRSGSLQNQGQSPTQSGGDTEHPWGKSPLFRELATGPIVIMRLDREVACYMLEVTGQSSASSPSVALATDT
jgi:hypothetical protein